MPPCCSHTKETRSHSIDYRNIFFLNFFTSHHSSPNNLFRPVGDISIGEDCAYPVVSVPTIVIKQPHFNDSNLLDEHGSPKRKAKTKISGNKPIDQLLHTIIDNILRGESFNLSEVYKWGDINRVNPIVDYIDSWFCSLSDNKEFSEFRTRNCIEESVQNVCHR